MATSSKGNANKGAAAPKNSDAAKAAKGEKFTYDVVSTLHHDGELYAAGDSIELTEDQAAPLLGHTVKAPEAAPE